MKQIYIILVLMMVITSCNRPQDGKPIMSSEGHDFEIITVDGCEYLERFAGYGGFLAHKGNCSNSIHAYNPTPDEAMRKIDSMTKVINSY